jgi:glycosyltransferase involved in cell wall biosynthesis
VRLVIAGNDMGGLETTRALISSLGIAAQTSIVGLLESRERLEALADADVVAYPSADEIFGLVPIEALLCGTPVVVADDSGCGEVIDSLGGGEVVRLGDVAALARALADVLAAPAAGRLRARGAAGRIRERYSGDVIAGAMTDLYRDLVAAAAA